MDRIKTVQDLQALLNKNCELYDQWFNVLYRYSRLNNIPINVPIKKHSLKVFVDSKHEKYFGKLKKYSDGSDIIRRDLQNAKNCLTAEDMKVMEVGWEDVFYGNVNTFLN